MRGAKPSCLLSDNRSPVKGGAQNFLRYVEAVLGVK